MVSLTLLLMVREGGQDAMVQWGGNIGAVLLVVSSYLSTHSLVVYMRALWKYMA